jgi:hypothetical protein
MGVRPDVRGNSYRRLQLSLHDGIPLECAFAAHQQQVRRGSRLITAGKGRIPRARLLGNGSRSRLGLRGAAAGDHVKR